MSQRRQLAFKEDIFGEQVITVTFQTVFFVFCLKYVKQIQHRHKWACLCICANNTTCLGGLSWWIHRNLNTHIHTHTHTHTHRAKEGQTNPYSSWLQKCGLLPYTTYTAKVVAISFHFTTKWLHEFQLSHNAVTFEWKSKSFKLKLTCRVL